MFLKCDRTNNFSLTSPQMDLCFLQTVLVRQISKPLHCMRDQKLCYSRVTPPKLRQQHLIIFHYIYSLLTVPLTTVWSSFFLLFLFFHSQNFKSSKFSLTGFCCCLLVCLNRITHVTKREWVESGGGLIGSPGLHYCHCKLWPPPTNKQLYRYWRMDFVTVFVVS